MLASFGHLDIELSRHRESQLRIASILLAHRQVCMRILIISFLLQTEHLPLGSRLGRNPLFKIALVISEEGLVQILALSIVSVGA